MSELGLVLVLDEPHRVQAASDPEKDPVVSCFTSRCAPNLAPGLGEAFPPRSHKGHFRKNGQARTDESLYSRDMKPTTRRDYQERLLRVLVHVQAHLDEPLRLDDLARLAHFSPFHFHRIFRGMVGESVKQHVRRLRLERAAIQLKTGKRSVTEIAFTAGYEAHEAFTRAFRSSFGCSPTQYRSNRPTTDRIASKTGVHFSASAEVPGLRTPEEEIPMDVQIKTTGAMRVAFLRHAGPYDSVGETWERLMDWAGAECLFGPDTHYLGACYDDPEVTAPDKIRYDACVTVDETVKPTGDIGVQTIAGGRFAVVLHEGPYEKLGETYAALLGRWFPTQHIEPSDPPCLEFYLNDPESTDPEDLLTEIRVRIRG